MDTLNWAGGERTDPKTTHTMSASPFQYMEIEGDLRRAGECQLRKFKVVADAAKSARGNGIERKVQQSAAKRQWHNGGIQRQGLSKAWQHRLVSKPAALPVGCGIPQMVLQYW